MDVAGEIDELERRVAEAEAVLREQGRAGRGSVASAHLDEWALFDAVDEGFCIIEVIGGGTGEPIDYRFLQTNASFERQTGLTNAVGRRMRELAPAHEEHWFDRYARIARTQTPERFEDRADALGRWYDVYAFPVGDPALRRVGILFHDVIERKRAEQALSRSYELLRTTVDSSLQIIQLFEAVRDEQNAIVDFVWLLTNKQWNDRWGSNVGKRLLKENPAVVTSGIWDKFIEVMRTGVPITHEHFYKHEQFDGWFLQTIAKAGDGILLSTLDISDRKRAELASRNNEEKYRSLFETMGQGYCDLELVRDSDGHAVDQRYLELNPALERLFDIDAASTRGRTASEVFGDWVLPWTQAFDRIVKEGGPARVEQEVGERWFEVHVYPRGGDRMVALYEDVTERKRTEQRLRDSEQRRKFMLELSDTVRRLGDSVTIQTTASRLTAEHLDVGRVAYCEIRHEPEAVVVVAREWRRHGMPSNADERYPIDTVGPFQKASLTAGRPAIVVEATDDARLSPAERVTWSASAIVASCAVPVMKDGIFVAYLVAQDQRRREWTETDIALLGEVSERIWSAVQRARAEADRRDSEARFRQFADASSDVLWIRDAATLAATYVSAASAHVYGTSPASLLGDRKFWDALVVPDDRAAVIAQLDEVKHGSAKVVEFRVLRPSDGAFRWVRRTAFPLLGANGEVQAVAGISSDITDEKMLTEHQGVLLAELQHRVRNIMAIIRSIVVRTADGPSSTSDYVELLSGRLLTLSRVQALLTRAANAGVEMMSIVHDELAAHATHAEQFAISGPDVELSPKAAETMTLAVHELTTNALKHGALMTPAGKVAVSWSVIAHNGVPWLSFDWSERGAPTAGAASGRRRSGFGSELIEGRVPYELGGRGKLTIEPDGARCHLEFPLQDGASVLETHAPRRATVFGGAIDMSIQAGLAGQHVLVVEDDYYLATDASRALERAGAHVVGPCASEDAARKALADSEPTCAVLDINLNGGRSFALARELKRDAVPFVFITGYDQAVIPDDLADVTRLQKPVQLREIVGALAALVGAQPPARA